MTAETDTYAVWLDRAQMGEDRLSPEQRSVLKAAFCFRQSQGADYYSTGRGRQADRRASE